MNLTFFKNSLEVRKLLPLIIRKSLGNFNSLKKLFQGKYFINFAFDDVALMFS